MRKIRKGDSVVVLAGKDKGREGTILAVVARGLKALVEGINVAKCHIRGNPAQEKPGGIVEKERPLDISKLALVNPATGNADRVKFKFLEDGRKVRVFRSTDEVVDV